MQIAAVGIILDQTVLIVGAMVVGPEFGPLAGLCVALVNLRAGLARRSLRALAVGFPIGIAAALLTTLILIAVDVFPEDFSQSGHPFTAVHLRPGLPQLLRGLRRGSGRHVVAHVRQVGRACRGPHLGHDHPRGVQHRRGGRVRRLERGRGAALQLGLNLAGIVLAGVLTLFVQRRWYVMQAAQAPEGAVPQRRRAPGGPQRP